MTVLIITEYLTVKYKSLTQLLVNIDAASVVVVVAAGAATAAAVTHTLSI